MARRLEIELTSSRGDGTWTWRAAGAKEPRGVVDEKVLGATAHVGDVVRVEAELGLDGINVVAVLPPRERSGTASTIEIDRRREPGAGSVTSSVVERRGRREGPDGERRGPASDRGRPQRAESRPFGAQRGGPPSRERGASHLRGGQRGAQSGAHETSPASEGQRGRDAARRPARSGTDAPVAAPARPSRSRPARVAPRSVHRDALLDTLPVEQRPIAEQLATGGLPAVRRALAEERAVARAESRPEVSGEAILALAEQLLPRVKEATWRDRAEAVASQLETVALRDLRAVVASASARDEPSRALLATLRDALETRVAKLRTAWEHDIAHALEEGRVLQALRLSARAPEPTARFPANLVSPLAEAAGAALAASTPPERWLAVCEAAAASPVRRAIQPAGVPSDEGDRTRKTAAAFAGRIPALAGLLGLSMPPPPRPPRSMTGSAAVSGGRHVPPPPAFLAAPAATPEPSPAATPEPSPAARSDGDAHDEETSP